MPTTFDDKQKQFESLMNQADEARLEKEAALDRYKQAAIYGNILSSPRAANKAEILSGVTPVNYSEGMQKAWEQPAKIDVESAQGRYQSVLDKYKALKEESDAEKNRALLEKQLKTEQTKTSQEQQKLGQARINQVEGLADRLKQRKTDFDTLESAYENMKTAQATGTGASQIGALYSFVKVLDPTSAVREGEISLAQSANPLLQRLGIQYNLDKIQKGQVLPPSLVKDLVTVAGNMYLQKKNQFQDAINREVETAKAYGIEDRIIEKALIGRYKPRELGVSEIQPSIAKKSGGFIKSAEAAPIINPKDQQAIDWANSNPNDPRAKKILQLHGM